MTAPVVVWLVVGLASLVMLAAVTLGLLKQLKRLTGALAEFRAEIQPVAEQVRAESQRAQERAEEARRRSEEIRDIRETSPRRRRRR